MREDLHDPHRVAGADICDFEVLGFGRDGWVQHVLEAVKPKPVLKGETGGVLVAAIEHVIVVFFRRHVWRYTCLLFGVCPVSLRIMVYEKTTLNSVEMLERVICEVFLYKRAMKE